MADKKWDQMSGWEKAWEVTKVVGGIGLAVAAVAAALSGGGAGSTGGAGSGGGSGGGGSSVWTVGHGGKKGYGSWSSFRHR